MILLADRVPTRSHPTRCHLSSPEIVSGKRNIPQQVLTYWISWDYLYGIHYLWKCTYGTYNKSHFCFGGLLKRGDPQIIPLIDRMFDSKASIFGFPPFMETPKNCDWISIYDSITAISHCIPLDNHIIYCYCHIPPIVSHCIPLDHHT